MIYQILHETTDMSSYVIEYMRQKRICDGIGGCEIRVSDTYPNTLTVYQKIYIYEPDEENNLIKKGTFFISEIQHDFPDGTILIKGQDRTKQLVDYFVSDFYEIITLTTSKYWIEKFLVEAGIPYHFIADEVGHYMSLNTSIGMESLYDLLQRLCLENGWYFLANADNEIEIGKLLIDYDNFDATIGDDRIINFNYTKDDKMLRNRVVIRGNADFYTGIAVGAEMKIITPWNYDTRDYRAVVIMSPDIPDVGLAYQLAKQVLDETRKITEVKSVEIEGFVNVNCGDCVYIDSSYPNVYHGIGLITTFQTKASKQKITTTLILDERCPRLFGYYAGTGDVFIGTEGDGVWRKPLMFVHDWEDYSQGLQSLNVTDLSVANGVKSCIADGELYIRTPLNTQWVRQLPDITVSGIPSLDPYCMDSVVTRDNSTVEAIYADVLTVSGENRSFLVTHTVSGLFDIIPITVSGIENIYAYGMDHDGKDTYISTLEQELITISGTVTEPTGYENKYEPGFVGWDFREGGTMYYHTWFYPGFEEEPGWQYPFGWMSTHNSIGVIEEGTVTLDDLVMKVKPATKADGYAAGQWVVHNPDIQLSSTSKLIVGSNHWQRVASTNHILIEWSSHAFSSFEISMPVEYPRHHFKSYGPDYFEFELPTNAKSLTNNISRMLWQGSCYYTDPANPPEYPDWNDPDMYVGIDFIGFTDATPIDSSEYPPSTRPPLTSLIDFYSLLKYDGNTFERKLWLQGLQHVEISQQAPIILFGGDPVFNSGSLDIWYQKEIDPTYIFASGFVSDARSAMLLTANGLSPIGFFCINPNLGAQTSDLMYTDFSNTLTSGYTYGGWFIVGGSWFYSSEQHQYALANYHTFPGIVTHVETSNFSYDEPFILTSVTISGESNFYQKDGRYLTDPDTEFIVHNNFLPSSKILCIRMDDRI